jgi:hypothetical protein
MGGDARAVVSSHTSHIEYSEYVERAKFLDEQDKFARNNLVNNLLVEFIDIFDVHRCTRLLV